MQQHWIVLIFCVRHLFWMLATSLPCNNIFCSELVTNIECSCVYCNILVHCFHCNMPREYRKHSDEGGVTLIKNQINWTFFNSYFSEKLQDLYAFSYSPQDEKLTQSAGWALFDMQSEYARMGVPNNEWAYSSINSNYKVSIMFKGILAKQLGFLWLLAINLFLNSTRIDTQGYGVGLTDAMLCPSYSFIQKT